MLFLRGGGEGAGSGLWTGLMMLIVPQTLCYLVSI